MTKIACAKKTVTTEQVGGRPGNSAIDLATKTVIKFETIRLQRLKGGIVYNHAKACYGRVIENLSNIACMREGLPPEVATLHAQTLSKMKYYIIYRSGIAQKPNGYMQPKPFYGVGQGSGNAPACWGVISNSLVRAYNKKSGPAQMHAPISHSLLAEKVQAFVDNTTCFLIIPNDSGMSPEYLLQSNTQLWEELLNASGGKLELPKCKFLVFK
jgi:hypothetical protein